MSHSRNLPAVFLTGAVTLALAACTHSQSDPRTAAPLVRTAVATSTGQNNTSFTGFVSARVESSLGFRVPGKVEKRLVDTGQVVRRGQPLMRIDRTDLALATQAASGTVESARARAIQTDADEKRYRGLVSAGAVSASGYGLIKASAATAAADLKAALALVDVAKNQAGYSVLVADADGTVVETLAEPGQVVAAGQTVVRLAHAGPREATVYLPESVRPLLHSQATASIYGDAALNGSATLRQLSDAADPITRTFDARYVLEGPAANSPLGATVTIDLPAAGTAKHLQIPLSALYDTGKGPGVWVITPRAPYTLSWQPVVLTSIDDETATISGGLTAGETFVALGAHFLHQGEAVRVDDSQGVAL